MPLQPGSYRITSKLPNTLVGRGLVEDRSLRPKRILAGAKGINECPWHILPAEGDDTYILRAFGSPAVDIEGKVFADLLDQIQERLWVVQAQSHQGANLYTITIPGNTMKGWVVPDDEEELKQVEVKPLTATKSLPPQFAAKCLFEIVPELED